MEAAGPRLDDTFQRFTAFFGAPRRTTTDHGRVVRQYATAQGQLTVLFIRGRAVALGRRPPAQRLDAAIAQAETGPFAPAEGRQHLLQHGNAGWVLALDSCPPELVTRLHEFA